MRLCKSRVQNYRSIRDTGWFEVEPYKTIMVGANEAGKTAVLQALQQIRPPAGVPKFDALRDYPRALYNDISTGKVDPASVNVASARFTLEADDLALLPPGYEKAVYEFNRRLDNNAWHQIIGGPAALGFGTDFSKDLTRMAAHADKNFGGEDNSRSPSATLKAITGSWFSNQLITTEMADQLHSWLNQIVEYVEEANATEDERHTRLVDLMGIPAGREQALQTLLGRLPIFILFNNYFRVKPSIHLAHLATRIETGVLDDNHYDYGNQCLLKLLGFTPRELSNLGMATEPNSDNPATLQAYKDQLDKRSYQLNAASVRLTNEIRTVWNPDPMRAEADRLRVQADAQYLKVVVEDDLGVEIELDQRSEGFQWLEPVMDFQSNQKRGRA